MYNMKYSQFQMQRQIFDYLLLDHLKENNSWWDNVAAVGKKSIFASQLFCVQSNEYFQEEYLLRGFFSHSPWNSVDKIQEICFFCVPVDALKFLPLLILPSWPISSSLFGPSNLKTFYVKYISKTFLFKSITCKTQYFFSNICF